jgi:hypothetical protein
MHSMTQRLTQHTVWVVEVAAVRDFRYFFDSSRLSVGVALWCALSAVAVDEMSGKRVYGVLDLPSAYAQCKCTTTYGVEVTRPVPGPAQFRDTPL